MPDRTTPAPATPAVVPSAALRDDDLYASSLSTFVTDSPSSYHAVEALAASLTARGFTRLEETASWPEPPRRGLVVRDGALIAWLAPDGPLAPDAAYRVVGTHTDSPALKLKPHAALDREGVGVINVEVYGGPLLNSFLDRELGLAGRLVTRDGATHLVRTGPLARVTQVAPHLDRSVNDSLHLDQQTALLPLWALTSPEEEGTDPTTAVERHLCETAGIDHAELAGHDVLTYPTEPPARFGRHGEFLASSRLDNLSSVHAALVALASLADATSGFEEALAASGDVLVLVANDHEEVGSGTRSGAEGPFLQDVLRRLGRGLGLDEEARDAMTARSLCVSADAGHCVHPGHPQLHDPQVRPRLGAGPLLKINARQRYATDAVGAAAWERACVAAGVPHQDFVSNNTVPCGTTIGPLTAVRLGMTTVDVGQGLLSMHSQREMCAVADGPWFAQALAAFWARA